MGVATIAALLLRAAAAQFPWSELPGVWGNKSCGEKSFSTSVNDELEESTSFPGKIMIEFGLVGTEPLSPYCANRDDLSSA